MELIYENGEFRVSVIGNNDTLKLQAFYEIRTALWAVEGREEVTEGQFEMDDYDNDPKTVYVVVEWKGEVVGGTRFIYAASGISGLPCFEYRDLEKTFEMIGSPIEVSRWCIKAKVSPDLSAKANKDVRLECNFHLVAGGMKYLLSQDVDYAYMDVCTSLYKLLIASRMVVLSRFGIDHFRRDRKSYTPARLDVQASAEKLGLLENLRACA